MVEKADGGTLSWNYRRCPLTSDPEDFGPFKNVVELWKSKWQEDILPARRDFDVLEFRKWLGKIAIVRLDTNPFEVRFVLWGTELTEWWGVDYTNKLLGEEALSPGLWKSIEGQYLHEMSVRPFIGLLDGQLEQYNRPHQNIISVDLPLWDGEKISHVIMFHERLKVGEQFRFLFQNHPGEILHFENDFTA